MVGSSTYSRRLVKQLHLLYVSHQKICAVFAALDNVDIYTKASILQFNSTRDSQ
jgi:hypothetical protein